MSLTYPARPTGSWDTFLLVTPALPLSPEGGSRFLPAQWPTLFWSIRDCSHYPRFSPAPGQPVVGLAGIPWNIP